MKKLLEAINRGILRGLNEQNIELLADLDDENLSQPDSLQTKSFNDKIDGSIMAVRQQVRHQLLQTIQTCKLPSELKQIINDPTNFHKFKGLIKANDTIHLKQLIKIGQTLFGNDGNFNWIDTSAITDMSRLFYNSYFNGHIELWDVSNVTDMKLMFYSSNFNQPIGDWDVSSVVDMQGMFCGAEKFNQPIGDWDVSNVTNMHGMFFKASEFNQPIGNWDVSSVTTIGFMFCEAYSFNQPINNWDVNNVTNIDAVFAECPIKEEYMPKGYLTLFNKYKN